MVENRNCYIEEDEIDLRELFQTIWRYRKFIFIFVSSITILTIIYVFSLKNIYQTDSIIEIGKVSNNLIENSSPLVEKLKTEYNVDVKGVKRELPYLSSVSQIKRTNNLIKISAQAYSKEESKIFIDKVIDKLLIRHNNLINKYKTNIERIIQEYNKELEYLNNEIRKTKLFIDKHTKLAQEIAKRNKSLSAIYFLEISKKSDKLNSLNEKKFKLQQSIADLQNSLLEIKPTHVIKTIVYENAVKPKRKLIIIVSFITSFILAIFLVFFIEFIRGENKEIKN